MLTLIDNYDSFTYNLVQAFQILGEDVHVVRNDRFLSDVLKVAPDFLVIGPGPGRPESAGISKECVTLDLPILGICLGHQAIGEVFGGEVVRAARAVHGKTSPVFHNNQGVFRGLPQGFEATRYHSLILKASPSMEVTAWTREGEVMGIRHGKIEGVQFHPESVATPEGLQILRNFLNPKIGSKIA